MGLQSIEEKIKLSSVVCRLSSVVCCLSSVVCRLSSVICWCRCRPCVRNSYLITSATNQYEYEDEIDDDNNENDENVDNSYDEINDDNNKNDEDDNNKNVDDSYVNCRPVSVRV